MQRRFINALLAMFVSGVPLFSASVAQAADEARYRERYALIL